MEFLIKAGYARDERIAQGFQWLLRIRQRDGGWAIPLRTVGAKLDSFMMNGDPVQPDHSKPFSHLVTGVVVRAFAAHDDAAPHQRYEGRHTPRLAVLSARRVS
jgi:hypothetical protein